jgi:hypothetical protein
VAMTEVSRSIFPVPMRVRMAVSSSKEKRNAKKAFREAAARSGVVKGRHAHHYLHIYEWEWMHG